MSFRASRARQLVLLIVIVVFLGATGGCKQGPWILWNNYAAHFMDGQGRVIDPQGGNRTTSEGQSYALFFALAANDRTRFDRTLGWTQTNLARGSLENNLPGWLWGKSKEGNWKLLDPNPAADADIWIAYSVLEAGRLWKDAHYTNLARKMVALIAQKEVATLPGFGPMLMPGLPSLFHHGQNWTVNPSYLPVFIFDRFAVVDPAGPWKQIGLNVPRLIEQSSRHGFAMDWVDYVPGDGFYPASAPGGVVAPKDVPPAIGSYDAIRVYLWAAMLDNGNPARSQLLGSLSGMGSFMSHHGAPPEKVSDQGMPLEQDGPVGFSAAVLPYLKTFPDLERAAVQQKVRMSAQLDRSTGLYGKDPAYYDQNLALFANGFMDGRFRFSLRGELKVEWTHS
jgi:endoglucanase